jgi:hypothetical protein
MCGVSGADAARYPGRCQTCGQDYAAGDSISRIAYRKWVHTGCYTPTNGHTPASHTTPAQTPVPQTTPAQTATPTASPLPIDDLAAIVRRLLERVELSPVTTEPRLLESG